jgi:hypothetical protein
MRCGTGRSGCGAADSGSTACPAKEAGLTANVDDVDSGCWDILK